MKRLIIVIAIIGAIISGAALTGCVRVNLAEKSGPITTKYYDFTDFTGIDIGYAFELVVTASDNYSVSITAGENVLEHLDVHKDGSTLVFGLDGWTDSWFSSWHTSPKVNITMPVLNELELSGAAKANISGFKSSHDFYSKLSGASEMDVDLETGDFTAKLSGSSRIEGKLIAANSDIELSGTSRISLTGSGGDIRLHCSGASEANLTGFAVNDAYIDFSGASHGSLAVSSRMDVSLSGASSLDYMGNPILGLTDISGASSMNKITAH
jgi:hypothetical protein